MEFAQDVTQGITFDDSPGNLHPGTFLTSPDTLALAGLLLHMSKAPKTAKCAMAFTAMVNGEEVFLCCSGALCTFDNGRIKLNPGAGQTKPTHQCVTCRYFLHGASCGEVVDECTGNCICFSCAQQPKHSSTETSQAVVDRNSFTNIGDGIVTIQIDG